MDFRIKQKKARDVSLYKTLYIKKRLSDEIERIAREYDTSWNNVVISMVESYLEEKNEKEEFTAKH